jgi:hypothetical protein
VYCKVGVNIMFRRNVTEVNLCVILVFPLAEIERELIVYGKIVETGSMVHRVTKVVVSCVTPFTMIPDDTLE